MSNREEIWGGIRLVSSVSSLLAVPAFFYFFGYRITGKWEVAVESLSWNNPFLYVIAVVVIGGAALAMLTFDVEKNDYRLSGKVVLKTLRRIVSIVIVVALVRLFIM
ncbi:hypothetical protein FH966_10475 [Lentibacillus cibarius]|uniref:Uncharacterized protein n=1 Tax=Lentibacillus cibarius TaxID=2583219 RepID=A0A549YJL1_9BACI|nr:hypothetical protein [Lentibacillus cibarius]TMN23287.1 hypothetical protein FFL34_15210 [Lentibacillus cibarius]TRM12073.1 hypothetical protein FH966_10475 [Lentibacillus cibarius]